MVTTSTAEGLVASHTEPAVSRYQAMPSRAAQGSLGGVHWGRRRITRSRGKAIAQLCGAPGRLRNWPGCQSSPCNFKAYSQDSKAGWSVPIEMQSLPNCSHLASKHPPSRGNPVSI